MNVYVVHDDTNCSVLGVFLTLIQACGEVERMSLDPECDDFEIGMTRFVSGKIDFGCGVELDPFTGLELDKDWQARA